MESVRRMTPTVSTTRAPFLCFAQHTKLLYVLFYYAQGSKSEAKKKKNHGGTMWIFQLAEVNSPLVNTKVCVGLCLESIITVVQGKFTSKFLNQWELWWNMCDVFSKCWSPCWVTAIHTAHCVVYVTQDSTTWSLKARISEILIYRHCHFFSSTNLEYSWK